MSEWDFLITEYGGNNSVYVAWIVVAVMVPNDGTKVGILFEHFQCKHR